MFNQKSEIVDLLASTTQRIAIDPLKNDNDDQQYTD